MLDRADVDTDQIIPKQFLKRIERTGFGEFLFYDWAQGARLGPAGQPDPRHRPELRLRLLARARAVGARGLRLQGDRGRELRRHLLLQLHEDRPAAGRAARGEDVRALMAGRRGRGRPRGARGPLRRARGAVRARRRDPPPPAQRARRHRADAPAARRRSRPTSRTRAPRPGDHRAVAKPHVLPLCSGVRHSPSAPLSAWTNVGLKRPGERPRYGGSAPYDPAVSPRQPGAPAMSLRSRLSRLTLILATAAGLAASAGTASANPCRRPSATAPTTRPAARTPTSTTTARPAPARAARSADHRWNARDRRPRLTAPAPRAGASARTAPGSPSRRAARRCALAVTGETAAARRLALLADGAARPRRRAAARSTCRAATASTASPISTAFAFAVAAAVRPAARRCSPTPPPR